MFICVYLCLSIVLAGNHLCLSVLLLDQYSGGDVVVVMKEMTTVNETTYGHL